MTASLGFGHDQAILGVSLFFRFLFVHKSLTNELLSP